MTSVGVGHVTGTRPVIGRPCENDLTLTDVEWNWPSVLWRCWLGGRKGIRPVKNWVVGAGVVICLERGADLHVAQLMPLPLTVSCSSKIQIGFTFLVPAHPGSPGQRAVKRVCVWCGMEMHWPLLRTRRFVTIIAYRFLGLPKPRLSSGSDRLLSA